MYPSPLYWWLTYRRAGKPSGVLIIEAPSLIHARWIAGVRGLDGLADFAEGHPLDAAMAARLSPKDIGWMLTLDQAKRLLWRLAR